MGNRIADEKVDLIRNTLDIVDIVGEYVQLKKQGRNFFGLCPFHGEKTPSFSVSTDKQIYHCFGCGAGGNMFSFVMEIEGISFVEAVTQLAEKANVDLPDIDVTETGISKEVQEMYQAHDLLRKLYHHLLVNTKEGERAFHYLKDRGFTLEEIKKFQIGYSPDSWELQTTFLKRRGFSLGNMVDAGLITNSERNDYQYFDRFRNRIMFPIFDPQGKTIAFGGRVIDQSEPKYLNSTETKIYNKSRVLYSFNLARPHIKKEEHAVLFEGYIDVIASWKAGVVNGVATLGTSLTDDQAKLIRRNSNLVTICYDSDKAGIQASIRASNILKKVGCEVRIAKMPEGFDPDDYIRKYGGESFKKGVIGDSITLTAFKMEYLRRGKNLQNEGERIRYIEEVIKEISQLDNVVEIDHYLRQLANEFSLSLDALKEQQRLITRQVKNKDNQTFYRDNKDSIKKVSKKQKLLPAYQNAERMLLAHMLRDHDVALKIQDTIGGSFNIDEHSAIAILLYAFYEEGQNPNISSFMQRIQDETLRRNVSEIAMIDINDELSEEVLQDYIRHVLQYPTIFKIEDLEQEKKEAEREQDVVRAAQIAMEIIKVKKELKNKN